MRTRELAAEMRAASEEMSTADVNELEALGIARREIEIFEMAGLSRIVRMTDAELYEPDETGGWAGGSGDSACSSPATSPSTRSSPAAGMRSRRDPRPGYGGVVRDGPGHVP